MQILLVDDDEMAARAIEWALCDRGVDARTLTSSRDVIGAIAEVRPRAVVLEVILDHGDGVSLCNEIRRLWPELPLVLTSGRDADFPGVQDAIAVRRTDFLQKPFEIDTLLDTIETLSKQ